MGFEEVEGTGVNEARNRAVFLDRDGTIIEDVDYLTRAEQIRLLPGSAHALRSLKEAGYLLLVVTNQSAVGRGRLTEEDLEQVHVELNRRLRALGAEVDAFYYCPHLPGAEVARYAVECRCRKPQPGLIERAAADWAADVSRSYAVGDSARDVEAGRRAGCRTVFIGRGLCREADLAAADLTEAARLILAERGS